MAQKSTELEQYLQRVRELEDMYGRLEDALEDERRARQDEEAVRRLQARSVNKERRKEKRFENTSKIDRHIQMFSQREEEEDAVMITVFTLISILRVFEECKTIYRQAEKSTKHQHGHSLAVNSPDNDLLYFIHYTYYMLHRTFIRGSLQGEVWFNLLRHSCSHVHLGKDAAACVNTV